MKTNKMVLAVILLLLIFPACIYLSFYFSDKAYSVEGPSMVHSGPKGTFYVLVDNRIVRINDNGDLLFSLDMADSGINRKVVDFNVRDDGSLLLGLAGEPRLVFYSAKGELLGQSDVGPSAPPKDYPEYFRIAESPDGALYLSDAYSDSVLVLSPSGARLFTSFSPEGGEGIGKKKQKNPVRMLSEAMLDEETNKTRMEPKTPYDWVNGIVFHDGLVYFADTNNHRVVVLNSDGSYDRIIPVTGEERERFEHPSDISVSGRDLYVLIVHPAMPGGNLVSIDLDSGKIREFDLRFVRDMKQRRGFLFHPTGLAASGNSVILTDRDNMAVYRFSRNGDYLGLFEPGQFGELLGTVRSKVRNYTYARYSSIGVMIVLLAVMLIINRKEKLSKKTNVEQDLDPWEAAERQDIQMGHEGQPVHAGKVKREFKTIGWLVAVLPFWGQFAGGNRWQAVLLFVPFVLCLVTYLAIKYIGFKATGEDWSIFIPGLMGIYYAGGIAFMFWTLSSIGLKKMREEDKGYSSGIGFTKRAFLFSLVPALSGLLGQLFYEIMVKDAPDMVTGVQRVVHNVFSFMLSSDQMAMWAVMGTVHFMFGYGGLVAGLFILLSINKLERGDRFILPGLLGFVIGTALVSLALVYANSIPGSLYSQAPLLGLAVGISVAAYSYIRFKQISLLVLPAAVAGAWAGSFVDMNIFFSSSFDLVFHRIFPDFLTSTGLFVRGRAVFVTGYLISLAVFMAFGVSSYDDEYEEEIEE